MSTATRYYSSRTTANQKPKVTNGFGGAVLDYCTLVLSQWYTGDTHYLFWLPRGAIIIEWGVTVSAQIDSNVSPTSTIEVGTADSSARFFAAEAFGQTAAQTVTSYTATGPVAGILPYVFSTTQYASLLTASNATPPSVLPNADFVNAFMSALDGGCDVCERCNAQCVDCLHPGRRRRGTVSPAISRGRGNHPRLPFLRYVSWPQ